MQTVHYHRGRDSVTIHIERSYKDSPDTWEPISEAEFLRRTEWAGYWKKGSALDALRAFGQLQTPTAWYRVQA